MTIEYLVNLDMKKKGQTLRNNRNATYVEDKKDLSMVHLQSFTIGACDHDEGHHLGMVTNSVKASRHHNNIK